MKTGDLCYFREKDGSIWEYTFAVQHEYQDACTIKNGVGERIVRLSELMTRSEWDVSKLQQEQKDQEPRLRGVIEAYNAGFKTSISIAEHLKIHHLAARGKMLAAHRLRFIALPIGADGFPDPNPKESNDNQASG